MGCNFLDEINGHITDLSSDLYTCIDFCDGPKIEYICLSCQPFFLKISIKLENYYKKVQNIFQEKQAQLPQQIMQIDTQNDKKCPTKEYTEPAVLNVILQNATGEYNESGGSLAHISIYSIIYTQQLFQVYNNKYNTQKIHEVQIQFYKSLALVSVLTGFSSRFKTKATL